MIQRVSKCTWNVLQERANVMLRLAVVFKAVRNRFFAVAHSIQWTSSFRMVPYENESVALIDQEKRPHICPNIDLSVRLPNTKLPSKGADLTRALLVLVIIKKLW